MAAPRPPAYPPRAMDTARAPSCRAPAGATLLELVCALTILAALLGLALPALGALADRAAARAARDALAAAAARTRALALARGGAALVVETRTGRVRIEGLDRSPLAPAMDLYQEYDVALATDGAAPDTVRLTFDALGLGRMTSRTFRLRRGRAEARLTIAAYGRIRSW